MAKKWLLRYISCTTNVGLKHVTNSDRVDIEGFVDSDYAEDRDSGKSTSAYFFLLHGNCVSWKPQLQ